MMNEIYEKALQHFSTEPSFKYERDHVLKYPAELIYCYENNLTFNHFENWAQLQDLLYEKVSYDEYYTVATAFSSPRLAEIDSNDFNTIGEIRSFLDLWRESEKKPPSLWSRIKSAVSRLFGIDDSQTVSLEKGSRAQAPAAGKSVQGDPDYQKAKEYYNKETYLNIDEHYSDHAAELIYCHQHNRSFNDFQRWCQYQDLLGDKLSYEHYSLLDAGTNINILSVSHNDKGFIYETRHYLDLLRKQDAKESVQNEGPKKPPLSAQIKTAESKAAQQQVTPNVRAKPIDLEK